MVDTELDIGGFESLSQLKKSVQQEKIQRRIYEEYAKTPIGKEPNRKKLAKLLGISENTISMAFEETARPKEDDISGQISKALGIATPMLLLQEDNISKISEFLGNNAFLTSALGGGVLFWQQFVKPRIDDPKNELSELEVLLEIMKSRAGQAYIAGLFGIVAGDRLLDTIELAGNGIGQAINNFGLAVQNGLINFQSNLEDELEELVELFGLKCIICVTTGEKFETFYLWVLTKPKTEQFTYLFNPISGFTAYYSEKKEFIDRCGAKNIMLCEDYEQQRPGDTAVVIPEEIATAPGESIEVPDTKSTLPQDLPPDIELPEDIEGEETQAPGGGQAGTPGVVSPVGAGGPRRLVSPGQEDIIIGPGDL